MKISQDRFLFTSTSDDNLYLILLIFDIFNDNKNKFIRYYKISLKLYNLQYYTSLRGISYNSFIGLNSTNPLSITNIFTDEDEYIF